MPLDPNIFFQGAALQQANAARTQATMDNLFNRFAAQKQREYELQNDPERQLRAAVSRAVSGNATEQDRNIIKIESALKGGSTQYKPDELGNVRAITEPTLYDRLFSASAPAQMQAPDVYGPPAPSGDMQSPLARKEAVKNALETQQKQQEAAISGLKLKEGVTPTPTQTNDVVKIKAAYDQLIPMIEEYKKLQEKYGAPIAGTEGAMALNRASGAIVMTLKELEGLGALQKPDIEAMDRMLGSPILMGGTIGDVVSNPIAAAASTYTKATKGREISRASSDEFKNYLDQKLMAQAGARGYEVPKKDQSFPAQYEGKKVRNKSTGQIGVIRNGKWQAE